MNLHCIINQELYSLSGRTSYHKNSWSIQVTRFRFRRFQSLWHLAGISGAAAIRSFQNPISRFRDFMRFGGKKSVRGKTSVRLVNRGPGSKFTKVWNVLSLDLEATRYGFRIVRSVRNLTAMLDMYLYKHQVQKEHSRNICFPIFCDYSWSFTFR